MACITNKGANDDGVPNDYEKRLSFITDLGRFNENRGTPFDHIPEIGGRKVDLYHLYNRVTGYGGWQKVNNAEQWQNFQEEFGLPKGCVNSSQALKNIYFRYLNFYEKVNFLGQNPDLKNDEEDDVPIRKKVCLPVETIPLFYNYSQHKLTDDQRRQHSLSTETCIDSKYDKLTMSLCSGLPNEVDLAVNVCVLLSAEGKHWLKLGDSSQLLRLLLAHVGVFDEKCEDMQDLYQHCWTPYTKRNFLRFWFETVDRTDIKSLIIWRGQQYVQREHVGSDVLNLGRDLGVQDVEGQRVLQIAVFLHNLSFEEANQKILASSHLVYKFLLLSLHSTYGGLKQLALDTLANISCELALDGFQGLSSHLVLDLLDCALFSEDRFFVVRGLEILSKLSQLACNESILLDHLKDDVYKRLVALLTVQDIQLIVHTLEALYKLSKVGEPFTTRIAHVHRAVDILVSLITIKAQSFGPGSLVGIKVVEYVPPAYACAEDGDNVRRATMVIQPTNPDSVNIYQVPASSMSQFSVPDTGGGAAGNLGGGKEIVSLITPVAHQDAVTDVQTTTSSWLSATYELKKKSKVNQVELFSDYLQFCRKIGIGKAMSSADFLHLVKVMFHQCEVLSINRKNGDRDVYLDGLCKRSAKKLTAGVALSSQKGSAPSSAVQGARRKNSKKNNLSLNASGEGKTPTGRRPRVLKTAKVRTSTPVNSKRILLVTKSTGITSNNFIKTALAANQHQLLNHKLVSGKGHSFPAVTLALQTVLANKTEALGPHSVKSLLAKKLSQGNPDQDLSASVGPSNLAGSMIQSSHPNVVATSASLSASLSSVACTVSTSSTLSPDTVTTLLPSSLTTNLITRDLTNSNHQISQSTFQVIQNDNILNQIATGPSSFIQNNLNIGLTQQNINSTLMTQRKKNLPLLHQSPGIHRNKVLFEQSAQVPVLQQNSVCPSVSQNSNTSKEQHSTTDLSRVSPTLVALNMPVQQNTIYPCAMLPKMVDDGDQNSYSITVSAITPQSLPAQSSTITVNHPVINPSILVASHQADVTSISNTVTIAADSATAQCAAVTHSLPSLSVGALHSTSSQQESHLVSSSPVITNHTQAPQTISRQVPTTMFMQTPSGAVIMPSRQVMPQGSSHESCKQKGIQDGTVSCILPSHCKQDPAVTVQELNCAQSLGSANIFSSNILTNSTSQSQPPIHTGNVQQNQQTPAKLSPRQIVVASYQASVPAGVQISSLPGNVIRSTSNTGVAHQQYKPNIVNQSSSISVHSEPSSANVIMNNSQGHQSISSQIPLHPTESQSARPDLHSHDQQQQIVGQTSHLLIVNAQTHQQQQHHVPPSQCKGLSHEVNGTLGSPESIGSDFPPSPLSTGLVSDKDYQNGKFMEMDSDTLFKTNDIDIGNYLEKTHQINGYVHPLEGNHDSVQLFRPGSQNCQDNGLNTMSRGVVVNGCDGSMLQTSDSSEQKVNILVHQGDSSSNISGGPLHIQQAQGMLQLGEKHQVATKTAEQQHQQVVVSVQQNQVIGFAGRQQFQPQQHSPLQQPQQQIQHAQLVHKQPQKLIVFHSQNVQNQQLLKHTQPQQVFQHELQHHKSRYTGSQKQISNVQQPAQFWSQTSSLSSKSSGPQTQFTLDVTRDCAAGNNGVASTPNAERIRQVANVQPTQTLVTYQIKSKDKKLNVSSASQKHLATSHSKHKGCVEGAAKMQSHGQKTVTVTVEYMCEWANCRRCFSSSRLLFLHIFKQHLPKSAESICQWSSCEKLVRKRWSLVSHIQDRHCSELAVHAAFQKRYSPNQQQISGSSSAPASTSHQPLSYPLDAAVHAIKRFSLKRPYPEFTDQREGPVSKHIHLMAALILRNISHFSPQGRRLIKRHEQELIYNTMSAVEASSALSQCLWEIVEFCEQKQDHLIS